MRRTVLLLASIALAVLVVSGVALVGVEKPAEATMPGANGKIAFEHFPAVSTYAADRGIWTMNADGGESTKVSGTTEKDRSPAWSPDGSKIAFTRRDDVGRGDVYVMNADGSNVTRLTEDPLGEGQPTWSPDGSKIAFSKTHVHTDYTSGYTWQEIWVMNADGSGETRLTNDFRASSTPDWSPDGSKIAFTRIDCAANDFDCMGNYDIWVINADGSGETKLTTNPLHDRHPSWSPDGSKIAFDSYRFYGSGHSDYQIDIWMMNADGSGERQLTNDATEEQTPEWSPDGTNIVFKRGVNIWRMNADGSGQTTLTSDTYPDLNYSPSWQPLPSSYDLSGFFSPVNNPPSLNMMKAGNAVPVKFSLNGDQGLDVFAESYPKSQEIDCDSTAQVDSIEQTATAGESSLSYDATTDQYTYVWKTEKAWAGTCRQFTMKLDDGSTHLANFKFRN